MRSALIVGDRWNRGALAAVRGLHRAGWRVGVGSQGRTGHAQRSKHCDRWHEVPLAEAGEDKFAAAVQSAIKTGGYDVVFAVGDAEVLTLSKRRAELAAVVPFPEHDIVERCFDKSVAVELAAFAGLAVPEPGTSAGFPVVVKARQHWLGGGIGTISRFPIQVAHDNAELKQCVAVLAEHGVPAIVQRQVEGDLVAVIVLVGKDGTVLARQQQVAERVWPRGAGVSVRARVVPCDPELNDGVDRFLADLGWWGLCELQFLVGPDEVPRLIDVNGRFYGSLALAEAAGLPLAAMWAGVALGDAVAPASPPAVGTRYHWLAGDLRRARAEHDFAGTVRYAFGSQHSIWSWRDARPALGYLRDRVNSRRGRSGE
jgi:predicted ATP-grasp superfamily ATP-dependent carboligase